MEKDAERTEEEDRSEGIAEEYLPDYPYSVLLLNQLCFQSCGNVLFPTFVLRPKHDRNLNNPFEFNDVYYLQSNICSPTRW